LQIDDGGLSQENHPLASVSVYCFPPWVVTAKDGRDALRRYLASFPQAEAYDSYLRLGREPDASPAFEVHEDGWGELRMHWRVAEGLRGTREERQALLQDLTRRYRGRRYFFPALDTVVCSIHPMMAWWAVLHTLSMLARYHPAEWAVHVDVDRSPNAVAIERLLATAIRVVPELILEAITDYS
jgi:hypothetical protein